MMLASEADSDRTGVSEPTLGEFHDATAATPPMCANRGISPCVCQPNLVIRPLGPSEQLTAVRDRPASS